MRDIVNKSQDLLIAGTSFSHLIIIVQNNSDI